MLRPLALPVALLGVLAAVGCAAESPTPTSGASAGATSGSTASGAAAPTPTGAATPQALMAAGLDPGVPGLPDGSGASIDDVLRLGAIATWTERPSRIALSLPASSSCWAFAAAPVAESADRIVVRVEEPQACTSPDDARTYELAVPDGIDAGDDVRLAVVGLEHELTLTLPGV